MQLKNGVCCFEAPVVTSASTDRTHVCFRLQRAQLQDQEAGVLSEINVICTPTSYVFVDPSTLGPLQSSFEVFRLM